MLSDLLGDMNIIKELKLANDNLKWRLEQRNKTLLASKAVIESLRKKLEVTEGLLERALSSNTADKTSNMDV